MMTQENSPLMLVDFDPSTKLPLKSPESRSISSDCESTPPQFASLKKEKFGFLGNRRREKSGISSESSEAEAVEKSNSFVGTTKYVAPEVILGDDHNFSVDWWCLGIVMYEMLYETTPLRGSNQKETFYRIVLRRRTCKLESAATLGIKLLSLTKNLES